MSVMRCDSCEAMIDTDYHVEDIVVWDGPHGCCCLHCFEKLDPFEAWNLALETAKAEFKRRMKFGFDGAEKIFKELEL